jgi:mRNA interferase RelE/StbE
MKRYEVVISKRAEKDLHKLPDAVLEKIVPALIALEENPRPAGCKKLKGYTDLWRIRIGDYRAIYAIEDVILLVDVRAVGNRKDIYQ